MDLFHAILHMYVTLHGKELSICNMTVVYGKFFTVHSTERKNILLTRVQANTDPDFQFRHVPHLEGPNAVEDVKRHVGHLSCMAVAVPIGDS